jgi:hypothetical protein
MSAIFSDTGTVRSKMGKGISIGVTDIVLAFENTERSVIISVVGLEKERRTYDTVPRRFILFTTHSPSWPGQVSDNR